jgi:hypothetical protein
MSTRTRKQIKEEYDEVQSKLISLSSDLVVLRNELDNLVANPNSSIAGRFVIFDKLNKYNELLDKLGIKKVKLIEEYNS